MDAKALSTSANCRVVEGEKYLGAERSGTLCREIEGAVAANAPGARYSVEVRALSPTRLAAVLIVNGRRLPEHKFAVMDGDLSEGAIRRFASALAVDVGKAAKK